MIHPGAALGPYTVTAAIGKGGMGEVYRATDRRLGREVALKVLSGEVSGDTARVERFEREARAASSLSHPAIVTIFDVGTEGGTSYIAMELVDGHSLRDELHGRPLASRRVVQLATAIADGLARAHQSGIVHRDLKPENIMVGEGGSPKIVDFGLAKLMPRLDEGGATTRVSTAQGTVLGTVTYMSPEQASGRPVDFRSDQFSFGTMLYEMSTGRHPFAKDSSAQTLAAIIDEDPVGATQLNPALPPPLAWVIDRCLAKDPADRYASTDDLARDLKRVAEHASDRVPAAAPVARHVASRWAATALAAVAVIAALLIGARSMRTPAAERIRAIRLTIPMAAGEVLTTVGPPVVAISPDARYVAYVASRGSDSRLFVRALDEFGSREIPDTSGAYMPFFSPDSRWVAFFSGGKLKKIARDGTGTAVVVADVANGRGGDWVENDIVYAAVGARDLSGLWTVSADGGTPRRLTTVDRSAGELTHRAPQFVQGARSVLYTVDRGEPVADLAVVAVATGEQRTVLENASSGRLIPPGFILFGRNGVAHVQPFSVDTLTASGRPVPVSDDLGPNNTVALWDYATAGDGSLAFVPRGSEAKKRRTLVWVSHDGTIASAAAPPAEYQQVRISPSGDRIAVSYRDHSGSALAVIDSRLGRTTALPTAVGGEHPAWSPDGTRLAFRSVTLGTSSVHVLSADGTGQPTSLLRSDRFLMPQDWSRDGQWLSLVRNELSEDDAFNHLWAYSVDGAAPAAQLTSLPGVQVAGRISPDGRWLAYINNPGDGINVFVTAFPVAGQTHQITSRGGRQPTWSRDGRQLFYREGNRMMAVPVQLGDSFRAGVSRPLFTISDSAADSLGYQMYDVAPDGRFLMIRTVDEDIERNQINVVLGWGATLPAQIR